MSYFALTADRLRQDLSLSLPICRSLSLSLSLPISLCLFLSLIPSPPPLFISLSSLCFHPLPSLPSFSLHPLSVSLSLSVSLCLCLCLYASLFYHSFNLPIANSQASFRLPVCLSVCFYFLISSSNPLSVSDVPLVPFTLRPSSFDHFCHQFSSVFTIQFASYVDLTAAEERATSNRNSYLPDWLNYKRSSRRLLLGSLE